ncbi:MAG TPA: response regulator transcription factor [Terriglobales bacterium]
MNKPLAECAFAGSTLLIVDDFAPWRAYVRQILGDEENWKSISEACDGSEAVEKAANFRPDIILLDIGLPRLNGLEAAKLIHQTSPDSRIIFVSQNSDQEIRALALELGRSYVLKVHAGSELLDAVVAALDDTQPAIRLA